MLRIALAAIMGTAVLALAGPAASSTPQRLKADFSESDSVDCSGFNPDWTFHDDFVDSFHIESDVWFDAEGNPVRVIQHVQQTSTDVNSVTGFTLHEHNHFTVQMDLLTRTAKSSGAFNIMERRGVGEVIHSTGHRLLDLATGEPLVIHGPVTASDADFCAAIAP
jgi:hypothetical protein